MQSAWTRGATGDGIKIGVVDTGVDTTLTDLAANIFISRDMASGRASQNISATERHGTRVAGVIAHVFNGTGTVGVAYNSDILSYRVDTPGSCDSADGCSLPEVLIANGIDRAVADGARVINLSLGSGTDPAGSFLRAAMARATQAGVALVFSAGNESLDRPGYPGFLADGAQFGGRIIIAGSIDNTSTLAASSNRAGALAQFYLAAPGVAIIADCNGTSCWSVSGTSVAAPHVTGAMALLLQAFPSLTIDQIIAILYQSATDLGAVGVDDVYGRGKLNLATAFSALGTSTTTNAVGDAVRVDNFGAQIGGAYGDAFSRANLNTGIIDSYGRSFNVDLSRQFRAILSTTIPNAPMNDLMQQSYFGAKTTFNFTPNIAPSSAWGAEQLNIVPQAKFSGQAEISGADSPTKVKISFAHGGNLLPNHAFASAATNGNAFGIYGLGVSDNSAGISLSRGNVQIGFLSEQGEDEVLANIGVANRNISALNLNLQHNIFDIGFELGSIKEHGSIWGLKWSAQPQVETKSEFVGISFGVQATKNIGIIFKGQLARIGDLAASNLFSQNGAVAANSFAITLANQFDDGVLRLGLEQPLRIYDGVFNYQLA
ncbi:MAG: S8 family peptidase, partial [Pseudomonadota bacterium]